MAAGHRRALFPTTQSMRRRHFARSVPASNDGAPRTCSLQVLHFLDTYEISSAACVTLLWVTRKLCGKIHNTPPVFELPCPAGSGYAPLAECLRSLLVFGPRLTFNEPKNFCFLGYATGVMAPFLKDATGAAGWQCSLHVLQARARISRMCRLQPW